MRFALPSTQMYGAQYVKAMHLSTFLVSSPGSKRRFIPLAVMERVRSKLVGNMSMGGHCYENAITKMNFCFKLMLSMFHKIYIYVYRLIYLHFCIYRCICHIKAFIDLKESSTNQGKYHCHKSVVMRPPTFERTLSKMV